MMPEAHKADRWVPPPLPTCLPVPFLACQERKSSSFSLFSNKNFQILVEGTLEFMGCSGMSSVSKEDNLVCSCPDDSELELGLGLSLGSGAKSKAARILTPMDGISASSSSSSSTSATTPSCGTKRPAHSVSPPRSGLSIQVVGWPPLRTYRMNSLVCQTKSPTIEEFSSTVEKCKSKSIVSSKTNGDSKNNNDPKGKRLSKTSLFVKVNMDGVLIGRKVDLSAHTSYEGLAHTLDAMFSTPKTAISSKCSNIDEKSVMTETALYPRLFHGSSQYVLTYEDKEGDWMLVGDVPWEMFLSSVKRLRIMRTSDAHGLSPAFLERNGRQRTKPI